MACLNVFQAVKPMGIPTLSSKGALSHIKENIHFQKTFEPIAYIKCV